MISILGIIFLPGVVSAEVISKENSSYVIKKLPKPLVCDIKDRDGNVNSEEVYASYYLNGKLVVLTNGADSYKKIDEIKYYVNGKCIDFTKQDQLDYANLIDGFSSPNYDEETGILSMVIYDNKRFAYMKTTDEVLDPDKTYYVTSVGPNNAYEPVESPVEGDLDTYFEEFVFQRITKAENDPDLEYYKESESSSWIYEKTDYIEDRPYDLYVIVPGFTEDTVIKKFNPDEIQELLDNFVSNYDNVYDSYYDVTYENNKIFITLSVFQNDSGVPKFYSKTYMVILKK